MARMKKSDLIDKIAREQNLDPEKLFRLNMEELEKMDKVIPDTSSSPDIQNAFANHLENKEEIKRTDQIEPTTLKVEVKAEIEIPVTFKVEDPEEEILRKTPGKYRKFIIQKGRN